MVVNCSSGLKKEYGGGRCVPAGNVKLPFANSEIAQVVVDRENKTRLNLVTIHNSADIQVISRNPWLCTTVFNLGNYNIVL